MNLELINKKIDESDLTINEIIEKMRTSRQVFYEKRKGHVAFTVPEFTALADILGMTPEERLEALR